ncbi:MAG: transposase [Microcoleus sp. PH2017_29_MFU_D_A]|uniref:RNA-guided endonuclease InsQ/TnpB family protein n=1 Tax=unclassified Microcoleus TaxID=2642155 RepID=UPI001D20AB85|nr:MULTISPECIES: RNA-guided endonuclease TnpB family protein [unclassified Microcoleus]MCC3420426.1 transposase [Microcoleus sp. PH2017_07_MST_O_A]MCC3431394.1 transposase [Microcoleus sp. PH2017_04_SCI_O_A]MCC3438672.1 transposase [Microcoleus sp. PH2017_05_CCC_O_A]MCC3442563.1 transposase [Microcoleus sp. PH2017_03_ELD_O_A]MCC3454554.1 transposase [Microcoleus sp. PH2017_08_TRC_O_A]MCC3467672.1 transposase [Microcoleus sp. PH2017_06_SFM_O_A]MCC3504151.1 transposase [Microcoleus sp. PH2017_
MLKAVKVRIYPSVEQQSHLAQAFGCVRWVWNQSLATMSQTYKETGKGISAFTMKKQIPVWKTEFEWLKDCYSQCLQSSVLNLSQAFINFFDGRAAYPTFKKRHGKQSIQFPQNVKVLGNDEIKFPGNLGVVKAKIHRELVGSLKTVTVSKMPDGRYYASLLMEDGIDKPATNKDGKAIGIDLGLLDFVVTSDGSKYQNPRHLRKHERNLKRKQRKLCRKRDKTTNKRRKAKLAVAKVHARISRVREDFRHKLSRKIVDKNQVIVVENLAVKNMVKNHNLALSISDAGWGMFCTMLKYKAEAEGKVYLEVGRFFPSSHLCSETLLLLPKMDLSVREFNCPHCSKRHDRDINAAVNIRNEGLRILTLGTSVTALGGNVRPKRYGQKSTVAEAVAIELGSPQHIGTPIAGG